MKELRPGSTGRTEVRVLFAFDRQRMAILLVGGDKGENWAGWYPHNIPIADERFAEDQRQVPEPAGKAPIDTKKPRKKGTR